MSSRSALLYLKQQFTIVNKRLLCWQVMVSFALAFWMLMMLGVSLTGAQEDQTWSPPHLLSSGISKDSGAPANMAFPILLVDEWGDVHSFWSVQLDEQRDVIGETVFYARWNGTSWSKPVDILHTPGEIIAGVQAAVGLDGQLHLVWTKGNQGPVWRSHAPVTEAGSARAWSLPELVTADIAHGLSMAIDADDNLHLVYCTAGENKGVFHIGSVDTEAWSEPVLIEILGTTTGDQTACVARIAIDERSRLHVVWGQEGLNSPTLYYARSENGGQTWLPATLIDQKDARYWENYGPTLANVATIGKDEVHIVWDGPPGGQRWHQWSADGGSTWSSAQQISPDLRGLTDKAIMAADSQGTLHLVTQGLENTGPFYAYWKDGSWSPFTLIDEQGVAGDPEQRANLVLVGGNTLHVAWDDKPLTGIWTASLQVDAPEIRPKPRPTEQTRPTAVASSTGGQIVSTPEIASIPEVETGAISQVTFEEITSPGQPVFIIGLLPVALFLGLVILVRKLRS